MVLHFLHEQKNISLTVRVRFSLTLNAAVVVSATKTIYRKEKNRCAWNSFFSEIELPARTEFKVKREQIKKKIVKSNQFIESSNTNC